jgi:hypothetical protein
MKATGWHGGPLSLTKSAGYGLRISKSDRDTFFKKSWVYVTIDLESESIVQIKLSPSFWSNCTELRSTRIGEWFLKNGLAPWDEGCPPVFSLVPTNEAEFHLTN